MDFHALTLGERNTYSGANGLALLVTFMAVTALAGSAATFGLVLAVAVAAGLWLTAWSLLVYDMVEAVTGGSDHWCSWQRSAACSRRWPTRSPR